MKIRIAVLVTTFNRVDVLFETMFSLKNQIKAEDTILDIFLLDDGSTDNTREKVMTTFPEIKVIPGDGTCFWNRGMFKLWDYASKCDQYQAYLWLNDDTYLHANALEELLCGYISFNKDAILVGVVAASKSPNAVTYSGYSDKKIISPNGKFTTCDYFNGNCVLIPHEVLLKIGNLDHYFRHSFGDFEYGMRAMKNGIKMYTTRIFIGVCNRNVWPPIYLDSSYDILTRFRHLYSPLGFNPFESFHLEIKYNSKIRAMLIFIKIHLNVIFLFIKDRNI
jgi:GT2 family glycosyltransferase